MTALQDGSIRRCLEEFAAQNYHHNEVLWRHLGYFHTKSVNKVYLCDLGSLTERPENLDDTDWADQTEKWIRKCIDDLSQNRGGEE